MYKNITQVFEFFYSRNVIYCEQIMLILCAYFPTYTASAFFFYYVSHQLITILLVVLSCFNIPITSGNFCFFIVSWCTFPLSIYARFYYYRIYSFYYIYILAMNLLIQLIYVKFSCFPKTEFNFL